MSPEIHLPEQAINAPDGTAPEIPTEPTVTAFQEIADNFMKGFNALAGTLPPLDTGHPSTVKFVRSHLNVSGDFLAAAIAAVEQTPSLQGTQKLDTAAARVKLQMIEAFTPVIDRVTAFRNALRYTVQSEKAALAASGLQVYGLSKQLARDAGASAGTVSIISHIAVMKRHLGRTGRPKAAKSGSPETPQPPATTAPAAKA